MKITLRAARINAEMTIKQVAGKIGVTDEKLRNFERGRTAIPLNILKQLVEIYGVTSEDIKFPKIK